jgi:hypothetical protein
MKKIFTTIYTALLMSLLIVTAAFGGEREESLVIDHSCTDLTRIPPEYVDLVKTNMKLHYAHTSHGSQLTHGVDTIEAYDAFYLVSIGDRYLPDDPGSFCIFRGQEGGTYVEPEQYWATAAGMDDTRDVLNNNPQISVSMFAWCTQLSSASEEYVQTYLDSMMQLESEFPNVTFVYMTGNAQSAGAAENRYARNQQIRQHCIDNNKVLYDFADLDCWWFNPDTQEWEFNTYTDYYGAIFPLQHPQFDGDELAHTTVESCVQKGKALWWMMAALSGWPTSVEESTWGSIKRRYR